MSEGYILPIRQPNPFIIPYLQGSTISFSSSTNGHLHHHEKIVNDEVKAMVDVLHTLALAIKGLLSWKPGKNIFPQFSHSLHLKDGSAVPLVFLSPLDRIRTGRRDRSMQLGLNPSNNESFEANQSFPISQKVQHYDELPVTPMIKTCTMDKFRGDALNTFSFSLGHSRGSFAKTPDSASRSVSFSDSWTFYNIINSGQNCSNIPTSVHNPNKAVVTINGKTSEILVANDMACRLFGYSSDELCKKCLADLFKHKRSQEALVETHLETSGELVLVSGKVVDVVDSTGDIIPVSLWMKKLETSHEPRCLAVMEPVERTMASVTFDSNGTILMCDKTMATLHGYMAASEIEGLNIQTLIPSLILPKGSYNTQLSKHIRKQRATGRTKDGATFPLSILIEVANHKHNSSTNFQKTLANTEALMKKIDIKKDVSEPDSSLICEPPLSDNIFTHSHTSSNETTSDLGSTGSSNASSPNESHVSVFTGIIWVFANISGMITILPNGTIHSCNHYFSLMLLGYSQTQLIGKNISFLIPTFYDDLEFLDPDPLPLPVYDDNIGDILQENFIVNNEIKEIKNAPEILKKIGIIHSPEQEIWLTQALQNIMSGDNSKAQRFHSILKLSKSANDIIKLTDEVGIGDRFSLKSKLESILENTEILVNSTGMKKENIICSEDYESNEEDNIKCLSDINGNPSKYVCESQSADQITGFLPKECSQVKEDKSFIFSQNNFDSNINHQCNSNFFSQITQSVNNLDLTCNFQRSQNKSNEKENESKDTMNIIETVKDKVDNNEEYPEIKVFKVKRSSSVPKLKLSSSLEEKLEFSNEHAQNMHLVSSPHRKCMLRRNSLSPQHIPYRTLHRTNGSESLNSRSNNMHIRVGSNCTSAYSSQGTMTDEEPSSGSCSSNTITISVEDRNCPNASKTEFQKSVQTSVTDQLPLKLDIQKINVADGKIVRSIPEGSYFGLGRHRDGSDLGIFYQIKRIDLDDGQTLYCLWVSRDPEEPAEGGRTLGSLTLASSVNSTLDASASAVSLGQVINEKAHQTEMNLQSSIEHSDKEYTNGVYSNYYTTLQQIGKGAFGCVKMAYRNLDRLLVITKFLRKSKVYDECWVQDTILKKTVPLEVSLLTTLRHPNIVQVLEVFENNDYFQMVMEKHGCGMDLFEFIDRGPNLNEPLASYIFRQVTSSVEYLHSLNILHRDIKDENIILNEYFQIKLIDFGSATFMAPNKLFSTFCGTVEYCSPEVLQGNKYKGPELEMWSLGVTLYTLIFGENPFFDVDETINAVLRPPFQASKELTTLISGLLNPDPVLRYTLRDLEVNAWLHQPVNIENYHFEDVIHCSIEEANPAKYYNEMDHTDQVSESLRMPDRFSYDNLHSELNDVNTDALVETEEELLDEYDENDGYS